MRKKGNLPNKINVIELRTDPKYGKFFEHKPSEAKVQIQRTNGKIIVDIKDFISPTVIERLKQQAGVLTPTIDDWRAMVDSVMIDTSYNERFLKSPIVTFLRRKMHWLVVIMNLIAPKEPLPLLSRLQMSLAKSL